MIPAGTLDLPPRPVVAHLASQLDQNFVRYVTRAARRVTTLDIALEVFGLTVDQTWSTFYVRGGMDPEFADPYARDLYLQALTRVGGERGAAAREAFLRGWVEHRPYDDEQGAALVWHRYFPSYWGGTAIRVNGTEVQIQERAA